MKQAEVRYYVDADVLGLAKVLASLRADVTYPGDPGGVVRKRSRPAAPITTTDVDDDVWIPIVAARGWSIITRDKAIQRRPAEIEAVRDSGAKMFALTSREQLSVWDQLEIVNVPLAEHRAAVRGARSLHLRDYPDIGPSSAVTE